MLKEKLQDSCFWFIFEFGNKHGHFKNKISFSLLPLIYLVTDNQGNLIWDRRRTPIIKCTTLKMPLEQYIKAPGQNSFFFQRVVCFRHNRYWKQSEKQWMRIWSKIHQPSNPLFEVAGWSYSLGGGGCAELSNIYFFPKGDNGRCLERQFKAPFPSVVPREQRAMAFHKLWNTCWGKCYFLQEYIIWFW